MTLRADVNSAYDEIAPPAPELKAEIRRLVSAEAQAINQSRGRRGPWIRSVRGTMALVAALLVVLIVASVLVGGRVWHDWNVLNNRPAPAGQIDPRQLAALEARPLHMPIVPPDGVCPVGPILSTEAALSLPEPMNTWAREGVVFAGGGHAYAVNPPGYGGDLSAWGQYGNLVWVVDPHVTGLVLIRGRDAANHDLPLVYVGDNAGGAVIGTDTIRGSSFEQRAELVLDAGHHPPTSVKTSWGVYQVRAGYPWAMGPCHTFQIDGDGFSEVLFTHPG